MDEFGLGIGLIRRWAERRTTAPRWVDSIIGFNYGDAFDALTDRWHLTYTSHQTFVDPAGRIEVSVYGHELVVTMTDGDDTWTVKVSNARTADAVLERFLSPPSTPAAPPTGPSTPPAPGDGDGCSPTR